MLNIFIQSIVPQHFLSYLAGCLANIETPWLKNWFIRYFIKKYGIQTNECIIKDPFAYSTFNHFFIRQLDMQFRPIVAGVETIASPVDGTVAVVSRINKNLLLQAKEHYFDLETLLAGDTELAQTFYDGNFATLYLAPRDYHRVHMPITGKLIKTIFVPGRLFSVNRMTCELVPDIFSRNERLICLFDTPAGKMVVILVGAMIVGSIQTVWMNEPIKKQVIHIETFQDSLEFNKGDELGHFKLGSTVIVLFGKNKVNLLTDLQNEAIKVGQLLANLS